jgi:muramidase (phage lysozyme)
LSKQNSAQNSAKKTKLEKPSQTDTGQARSQPTRANSRSDRSRKQVAPPEDLWPAFLMMAMFLGVALYLLAPLFSPRPQPDLIGATDYVASPLPLVMEDGDPYLRALMRTISAAESNTADPYRLLYGGQRVTDLSVHPDLCVPIVNGPNLGDCTTAAGRYQFLTTTWESQARYYNPQEIAWYEPWRQPSFEAQYQDEVVHDWLADADAWGTDIAERLRAGAVTEVLALLSGTWTSLGYGIEDNSMSSLLPQIYEEMLAEELAQAARQQVFVSN